MDSFIYNHLCDPGIGVLLGMCSCVLTFAYCLVAFIGGERLADRQKYLRIVGLFWGDEPDKVPVAPIKAYKVVE